MDMATTTLSWLDRIHVAAVIRLICKERELTLADFAKLAQVSYSQLKAIARARVDVDEALRQKLERALGERFSNFVVEFEPGSSARSVDDARARRRTEPERS